MCQRGVRTDAGASGAPPPPRRRRQRQHGAAEAQRGRHEESLARRGGAERRGGVRGAKRRRRRGLSAPSPPAPRPATPTRLRRPRPRPAPARPRPARGPSDAAGRVCQAADRRFSAGAVPHRAPSGRAHPRSARPPACGGRARRQEWESSGACVCRRRPRPRLPPRSACVASRALRSFDANDLTERVEWFGRMVWSVFPDRRGPRYLILTL